MNKFLSYIIAMCAACVLCFTSCNTTKSVTSNPGLSSSVQDEYKSLATSYNNWRTFTTSGKVVFGGAKSFSSSMQMRMINNKSIVISLRPLLGIEVAKAYVSSDSIIIIDKYHKAYVAESLKRFSDIMPMSLTSLQDILIGRVFSLDYGTLSQSNTKEFEVKENANSYTIAPRKQYKEFNYSFELNKNMVLDKLIVVPAANKKQYTINYSDFTTTNGGNAIPAVIGINTVVGGRDVSLEIDYSPSKVKWNSSFTEDTSINPGYRRITANELANLIKQL